MRLFFCRVVQRVRMVACVVLCWFAVVCCVCSAAWVVVFSMRLHMRRLIFIYLSIVCLNGSYGACLCVRVCVGWFDVLSFCCYRS